MGYGTFFPGAERYGGARPTIEIILRSLNDQMGSAYSVDAGSTVFMQNLAIARCIADVWDTAERASNQTDPARMSEFLPRWERILALYPSPTDTDVQRRARIAAKFARIGRMPTAQAISDQLRRALGPITFAIVTDTADTAIVQWPYSMGKVFSLGTSPPTVSVTGVPIGTEQLRIIIDGAGALGVATFQWSLDNGATYSSTEVTSASFPIPGSSLTLSFGAGTYSTDNVYYALAYPNEWSSTCALFSVQCTKPTAMTDAEFRQRIGEGWIVLDEIVPSWVQYTFTTGSGFVLDVPNLDQLRFNV